MGYMASTHNACYAKAAFSSAHNLPYPNINLQKYFFFLFPARFFVIIELILTNNPLGLYLELFHVKSVRNL